MSKLKRVVIKEELVWLTGDFIKATILQQFLYWTERMKDIDAYIIQENKRLETHGYEIITDLTHGWIYKTAEELSEETMLNLSVPTMRAHIKDLINKGYLYQRKNPKYKWDHTTQYRIDLIKISHDLLKGGYHLEGYNNFKLQNTNTVSNAQKTEFKNFKSEDEKICSSKLKNLNSDLENLNSNVENLNSGLENLKTIPEITTEITSKITSKKKEDGLTPVSISSQNQVSEIMHYLNKKLGTNYRINNNITKLINERLNENYTIDDFKKVINNKYNSWMNTEFAINLRPKTLFSAQYFDEYLNELTPTINETIKEKHINKFANFEQRKWDFEKIERLAMEN